jgi:hypothetical protein
MSGSSRAVAIDLPPLISFSTPILETDLLVKSQTESLTRAKHQVAISKLRISPDQNRLLENDTRCLRCLELCYQCSATSKKQCRISCTACNNLCPARVVSFLLQLVELN